MNIRPLFFIDCSQFTAFLNTRYKNLFAEYSEIVLRGEDPETGEIKDRKILKEWNSARGLIARMRNQAAPFMGEKPVQFGAIRIEKQDVNSHTPWRADEGEYAEQHHRAMLCLVPSPMAVVYSGGEGAVLQVGMATLVNHRVLHSEINLGPCPTIRLIADVRREDAP